MYTIYVKFLDDKPLTLHVEEFTDDKNLLSMKLINGKYRNIPLVCIKWYDIEYKTIEDLEE